MGFLILALTELLLNIVTGSFIQSKGCSGIVAGALIAIAGVSGGMIAGIEGGAIGGVFAGTLLGVFSGVHIRKAVQGVTVSFIGAFTGGIIGTIIGLILGSLSSHSLWKIFLGVVIVFILPIVGSVTSIFVVGPVLFKLARK